MKKKFKPQVQIIASNDGKNWICLNQDSRFEEYCLTDIHLNTIPFTYLNVVQYLKKPRKIKKIKK